MLLGQREHLLSPQQLVEGTLSAQSCMGYLCRSRGSEEEEELAERTCRQEPREELS